MTQSTHIHLKSYLARKTVIIFDILLVGLTRQVGSKTNNIEAPVNSSW